MAFRGRCQVTAWMHPGTVFSIGHSGSSNFSVESGADGRQAVAMIAAQGHVESVRSRSSAPRMARAATCSPHSGRWRSRRERVRDGRLSPGVGSR